MTMSGQPTKQSSDTLLSKVNYPSIDTTKTKLSDSYYQFIPATDSTSYIKWGNKSMDNISFKGHSNYLLSKGDITIKWFNNKFITLYRDGGSDTWLHIILPLVSGQDAKVYENPLAVDKDNGIIVYEYCFCDSDTILIAENIITNKKQPIINHSQKCSSSIAHYCIDNISISKGHLYFDWLPETKIDKTTVKKQIKRIKLDI